MKTNKQVNILSQDKIGKTALHYFVESEKLALAKLVIAKDARLLYIKDSKGMLPLDYAMHNKNQQLIKLLTANI